LPAFDGVETQQQISTHSSLFAPDLRNSQALIQLGSSAIAFVLNCSRSLHALHAEWDGKLCLARGCARWLTSATSCSPWLCPSPPLRCWAPSSCLPRSVGGGRRLSPRKRALGWHVCRCDRHRPGSWQPAGFLSIQPLQGIRLQKARPAKARVVES